MFGLLVSNPLSPWELNFGVKQSNEMQFGFYAFVMGDKMKEIS